MLALFEVLSLKGWVEVRDVIIHRVGPVMKFLPLYTAAFVPFSHVLRVVKCDVEELKRLCACRSTASTSTSLCFWAV